MPARRMATPVVTKTAWKLREWFSFFFLPPFTPVSCLLLSALNSQLCVLFLARGPGGDSQALE